MANYVLLERIELNASAASVTFASIPQSGYTDLKVVASLRGDSSQNWGNITFNGGGTAIAMLHLLNNNGSVLSQAYSPLRFECVPSSYTSSTFSNAEMYIPNYNSTTVNKSVSMDGVQENNSTTNTQHIAAGLWNSTAAITTITVTPDGGGNFVSGSTLSLYGLAAVGTTPAIAPKASGGNITTDGTYWYHTFLSTGAFVPQTGLTADVLVIAGGGGGGGDIPGGAGAGGILYAASKSLTTTSYTCTVGAGGARGTQGATDPGTDGIDSYFDVLRAFGGARGTLFANGANGGSGSGGAYGTFTGGTSIQTSNNGGIGYGNSGGNSTSANFASAGGGGAGGAGGANSGTVGGAGGAGLNTWSSWASATNTGVSGYFAGGGGGGGSGGGGAGGSGGGGAGTGRATGSPAGSGVINTGSGGGSAAGGNPVGVGGTGGSGLVIIRYPIA